MKTKIKTLAIIFCVLLFLFALRKLGAQIYLQQLLLWTQGLGVWGWVAFIAIYIVAAVCLLPGSILTLGAGVLFGALHGVILVSIASLSGATAAFWVGRYFARNWIAKKIQGNAKFQALDQALAKEGWKIVLLTRLSPLFPFNLTNYFFGVTQVKLKDYVLASWAGMLPGTVMFVYLGSLAGNLAALNQNTVSLRTGWGWLLYGVGFLATAGVAVYAARLAKKILEKKIYIRE